MGRPLFGYTTIIYGIVQNQGKQKERKEMKILLIFDNPETAEGTQELYEAATRMLEADVIIAIEPSLQVKILKNRCPDLEVTIVGNS